LGDKTFRQELLEQMSGKLGANHYGEERRQTSQMQAERLLTEELKRRKWEEKELKQRSKTDPEKIKMARRLRRETVMTLKWIADRLRMGSVSTLAQSLTKK
jgi:hypothetical protein